MLVGYARVSTSDQNPALQLEALHQANCEKIFSESRSAAATRRPELTEALAYVRPRETLVVRKLDRLDRTLSELIHLIDELGNRGIAFKSLTEPLDTTTLARRDAIGRRRPLHQFLRRRDRTAQPPRVEYCWAAFNTVLGYAKTFAP